MPESNDNASSPKGRGRPSSVGAVSNIDEVLQYASEDRDSQVFCNYQNISGEDAASIQRRSTMDVHGYKRVLTAAEVNKILKKHRNDPHPIVQDDFRHVVRWLALPNRQYISEVRGKPDRLVSEIDEPHRCLIIVEERRTGRRKLALISMYRRDLPDK